MLRIKISSKCKITERFAHIFSHWRFAFVRSVVVLWYCTLLRYWLSLCRYDSSNPVAEGDVGMAGVAVDSVEDMKVGICLVFQLALCTYVQRNFMLQWLTEHLFLAVSNHKRFPLLRLHLCRSYHLMSPLHMCVCVDSVLRYSSGQDVSVNDDEWCSSPSHGHVYCRSWRTGLYTLVVLLIGEQKASPPLSATGKFVLCVSNVASLTGVPCGILNTRTHITKMLQSLMQRMLSRWLAKNPLSVF